MHDIIIITNIGNVYNTLWARTDFYALVLDLGILKF